MKLINILIIIVLILSVILILSIELNLSILIETDMSKEKVYAVNNIFLNLSYGYVAGFLIYFLTVSIPSFKKKNKMKPLIEEYISKFYNSTIFNFYMFYNQSGLIDIKIKEHENVKDFFETQKKWEKILDIIAKKQTYSSRKEILERFSVECNSFLNKILPYEEYLSTTQLDLLNQIRRDDFLTLFEHYDNSVEELEDMKELFFERFVKYTKLIYDLNKTVSIKDNRKFYWKIPT